MDLDKFRDVDLVVDHVNDSFFSRQFVSQNDNDGRTLTVLITNGGVVGEVPGLSVNLRWTNQASGLTDLSAFELIDKATSKFQIKYPKNMLNPGKVIASIQIIQNGQVAHSKNFEITVQQLAGQAEGIITKAEYSALVEVLADSNKFRTDIDTLETIKADKLALNATNADISNLKSSKVDKNGAGQVGWGMLAQDAREQITGDKVAVVGVDSVSTENIVNGSVTLDKMVSTGKTAVLSFAFDGGYVNFEYEKNLVSFPEGTRIYYDDRFFDFVQGTVSLQFNETSAINVIVFDRKDKTLKIVVNNEINATSYVVCVFGRAHLINNVYFCTGKYRLDGKLDLTKEVSERLADSYIAKNFVTSKLTTSDLSLVDYTNKKDTEILSSGGLNISAGGYCFIRLYLGHFNPQKTNFILKNISDASKVTLCAKKSSSEIVWGPVSLIEFNDGYYTRDLKEVPVDKLGLVHPDFIELRFDNRSGQDKLKIEKMLVSGEGIPAERNFLSMGNSDNEVWVDGASLGGDGSATSPFNKIKDALDSGAKIINIVSGTYREALICFDRDSVELRCVPETNYSANKPDRQGVIIDNSETLALEKNENIYFANYVAAKDSNLYKVFVSKELTPNDPSSGRSIGYFATIWEDTENYSKDRRLIPVTTLDECESEQGSFYYDGNKIYINPFDNSIEGKKYQLIHEGESAIQFERIRNLKMNDIVVKYAVQEAVVLREVNNFSFSRCEAWRSSLGNGFSINNSNGVLKKCFAANNRNDGFNFHGFGDTHLIDCAAHYNFDDGNSHHDGCTGSVIGGEWSFNGKGGCSPSYGAQIDIYNTYCHDNDFGMYVVNTSEYPWRTVRHSNNILKENRSADYKIEGTTVIDMQNLYDTTDFSEGEDRNIITFR